MEWLIIESPEGKEEPSEPWLSTLPETIGLESLGDHATRRWRIERYDQPLKQEIGLFPDEGRGWRGFHHHAALGIAAYGFLIAERGTIPPSGPCFNLRRPSSAMSEYRRPRGAANMDSATRGGLKSNGPTRLSIAVHGHCIDVHVAQRANQRTPERICDVMALDPGCVAGLLTLGHAREAMRTGVPVATASAIPAS